jgi:hypothetical protein
MEEIKLEIVEVKLDGKSGPQIFVKKSASRKKRILSFIPDESQLKSLLIIFEVNTPEGMKGKTFQIPKEFDQTNLAFEYIIKKGKL